LGSSRYMRACSCVTREDEREVIKVRDNRSGHVQRTSRVHGLVVIVYVIPVFPKLVPPDLAYT
jgi:hypothetical protein